MTDELPAYTGVGREYAAHHRVRHSDDEFAPTDGGLRVHVNTAETAFRWNERAGTVTENLSLMVRFSRFPLAYGKLTA